MNNCQGSIQYNCQSLSSDIFKKQFSVVGQNDCHWAFLTCRETLEFATDLYYLSSGNTSESKEYIVSKMLTQMGLDTCENTVIGNALYPGLSGGQQRRLSLALALLKKDLQVLYLDEVTSGLDTASAMNVMKYVSEITRNHKIITIFTIHQPSASIYHQYFHDVMFLCEGKIAYCGRSDELIHYLASISHPIPSNCNPAEYFIEFINQDFQQDKSLAEDILIQWNQYRTVNYNRRIQMIQQSAHQHMQKHYESLLSSKFQSHHGQSTISSANGLYHALQTLQLETIILVKRSLIIYSRDPMVYIGRMIIFFVCSVLFALVYLHARDRYQNQALNREWFIVWLIAVPSNMGVIAVYSCHVEYLSIQREIKNGMINLKPYIIANTIVQVPMMLLFGLSVLPVAGYGIMAFDWQHFHWMWLIYALTMFCFESLAQLIGILCLNPIIGMLIYISIWFSSFLFCGLVVSVQDIVWPLRVISYITPLKYAFQMMSFVEFINTTFMQTIPCDASQSDTAGNALYMS